MIVISIVVLLMAVAVPLFRALTGDRSIEQGTNLLSSLLAQTRNQAIGNHEARGLCFYYDQNTGRYVAEIVRYSDPVNNPTRIDVVFGGEVYPLPPGIGVCTGYSPTVRVYSVPVTITLMGGLYGTGVVNYPSVVMFDAEGQVLGASYWVDTLANGSVLGGKLGDAAGSAAVPLSSQFVTQLFDREAFENCAFTARGTWLDGNASPLIVNRYNGTLIKGE